MRLNVVGTSGSGKSTFSKRIAEQFNIPYVELDALHWKANWAESTNEELFSKLEEALLSDEWILDGNYTRTQSIKWKRAEIVVYLDLPFHIVLYRVIRRSFIRGLKGTKLWAGNTETLWKHLFTSDSMILWTIKTFLPKRWKYQIYSKDPQYSHIKFVRLQSKSEIEDFITHKLHAYMESLRKN